MIRGLLFLALCTLVVWAAHTYRSRRPVVAPRRMAPSRPLTGYCGDCEAVRPVTQADRCETCQSVAVAVRGNTYQAPAVTAADVRRAGAIARLRATAMGRPVSVESRRVN